MIVNFSSIMSNGFSSNWLDTETKDRILFVDQNWSTSVQEDEISKEPSDARQSDSNNMKHSDPNSKEPLDPDNMQLSGQETSVKTQVQSGPSGEQTCVCVCTLL